MNLNPLSLVSDAAKAACDAILPDSCKVIGDAVAAGIDYATGNVTKLPADAMDFAQDLANGANALAKHMAAEASVAPGGDADVPPSRAVRSAATSSASTPSFPTADMAGGGAPGAQRRPVASPNVEGLAPRLAELVPAPAAAGSTAPTTLDGFFHQSDADFLKALGDGKIPESISKDPAQMLRLQQRLNDITQMNQLLTTMLAMIHDMNKAVIQNIRA